jgi:hypothetical protein
MARKPLTTSIDEEAHARIEALEAKVKFLWDMVVFLMDNPNYKVGDYLHEHGVELALLSK